MSLNIKIRNQEFVLHYSGAVYWPQKKMLLIADVHFGKIAHFRKHGAAVPASASEENFNKLKILNEEFRPETICFLGDLFHSKINNEWNPFEEWVHATKAKIILVLGNHDVIPKYLFEEIGVTVTKILKLEGFLFTHHPIEDAGLFNFSGHIHPGIKMKGHGKQFVKLPCFYKTKSQLILPAFGNFTGKHILTPSQEDEIFVIVEGEVICVSD